MMFTHLPLFVITISVPNLWNFSHNSLPSKVTFGSSTTPSSSGCNVRSGRIAGCSWWAATDARTTSSAVVYGVPSGWCGCGWCGGSLGSSEPEYRCECGPPGALARAASAAAGKYGWCDPGEPCPWPGTPPVNSDETLKSVGLGSCRNGWYAIPLANLLMSSDCMASWTSYLITTCQWNHCRVFIWLKFCTNFFLLILSFDSQINFLLFYTNLFIRNAPNTWKHLNSLLLCKIKKFSPWFKPQYLYFQF